MREVGHTTTNGVVGILTSNILLVPIVESEWVTFDQSGGIDAQLAETERLKLPGSKGKQGLRSRQVTMVQGHRLFSWVDANANIER